MYYRNYY